jgi:hypothetical protein
MPRAIRWLMAIVGGLTLGGVLICASALAQDAPRAKRPALSETQRLTIVALRQQVEIYQLREQLAARELQQAVAAAQVPGYRLTDQLTYEPLPVSKTEVPADRQEATP